MAGEARLPARLEDKARAVAIDLFQTIFKNGPRASLQELEVCFIKLDIGDKTDYGVVKNLVKVKQLVRDDERRPEEGGYIVNVQGK
jgi:hypothetical protein